MGLRGDACIVGIAERPSERKFTGTPTLTLEQWAGLAADALADAGIDAAEVDGLVCAGDVVESSLFVPATIAEYCGWSVELRRARRPRRRRRPSAWCGGPRRPSSSGICEVVVCATGRPAAAAVARSRADRTDAPSSARRAGSGARRRPSSTFPTATWRRTAATRCTRSATTTSTAGTSGRRAKIASDQRVERVRQPRRRVLRAADHHRRRARVARDRRAAAPARDRDAVHRRRRARGDQRRAGARRTHRPVHVTGFGERLTHKTPTYAPEMPHTPVRDAAASAFAMAGLRARRHRHGAALRLLHDHRAAHHRGLRVLRQGRGPGVRARARPLLPRRLPVQHPRRAARLRPDRAGRRDVARGRGGAPDPGSRRRPPARRATTPPT